MVRVKRAKIALKRRHNILRKTKGYRWQRSKKEGAAREALLHAYTHSFHDRSKKKGVFRKEWNVKINALARENGITYSRLIPLLKKAQIKLDRKILAELAEHHPKIFKAVLEKAMS